jgi:RNA polymerase sigma-70 factor (ECF subfamily)
MLATSDEKLLWKNISSGDHQAFGEFFDGYWEAFFQYTYKILQDREASEELVQEFFIHLWDRRADLPEFQSGAAYLFTALKNRILNHLSRKKYVHTGLEELRQEEDLSSAIDILERKNAEGLIRSLADALPEKMQQVYILHQFRGLSIAEIARSTGNSEQTIRNQFNTAIKKLSVAYRTRLHTFLPLSLILYKFFGS